MSIENIRRLAKKKVHDFFSFNGVYSPVNGDPQFPIKARIYEENPIDAGGFGGDGWVDKKEPQTFMVFCKNDVSPERGDKVINDGKEYVIDLVVKEINGYITVEVVS